MFQLQPTVDGTVAASVGYGSDVQAPEDICANDANDPACWDRVLWARGGGSCGAGAQIACSNSGVDNPEAISFAVTAGQSYYVFVDSPGAAAEGEFALRALLTPN